MSNEKSIDGQESTVKDLESNLKALYRYNPVVAMDDSILESFKMVDEDELRRILKNWMSSYEKIMKELENADQEELLKGEHSDIIQSIEESKEEAERLLSSLENN